MALRSVNEYLESLRDGRRVFYRGELVPDVTDHEPLRPTIEHAADLFRHPEDGPADFWSFTDPDLGEEISTFYRRPVDPATLLARGDVTEEATRRGRSTLNIVKVVGNDALFGLEQALAAAGDAVPPNYLENVRAYWRRAATEDRTLALAATDAKGDRRLAPHQQADPDAYLRVVERHEDGIVVRGAKVHTTATPSANELICIPCRAMGPDDSDYALAFAVPVNAPGLTLICHPVATGPVEEAPVSGRNLEVETITVFDDVFIPHDQVFLCGETAVAGEIARHFANFHRYTAISYKPPFIDLMIGAAAELAEEIGIGRSSAVREKLGRLIVYGELIRSARQAAAATCAVDPGSGLAVPSSVANNAGKFHFASGFHAAVALLQDIAGGFVVTAPGIEDLESPEAGPLALKYLAGADPEGGRRRWELLQLVRDISASEFGGYNYVVTLHGEGSLGAQLVQATRDYDLGTAREYAREIATRRELAPLRE
jgi:aromatic ring hydroxylase